MSLHRRINAGLVVASTVLSVVGVEVLARVIGIEGRHFSVKEITTRSLDGVALWDEKYARESREDIRRFADDRESFKIVGLGDSVLYGVSLAKDQTYLERARTLLAAHGTRPVAVLNLAIPGYNTEQELVTFREIADRIDPDLVLLHYWEDDDQQYRVIGCYVVDLGNLTDEQGYLLMRPLPLPETVNDFLMVNSRLYDALGRFRSGVGREPSVADFSRVSRALPELKRVVESRGARLLVLASPVVAGGRPRPIEDFPRLRELTVSLGIELIDVADWLRDASSEEIALDGCHLNAAGHELLGRHLARYLWPRYLQDPHP